LGSLGDDGIRRGRWGELHVLQGCLRLGLKHAPHLIGRHQADLAIGANAADVLGCRRGLDIARVRAAAARDPNRSCLVSGEIGKVLFQRGQAFLAEQTSSDAPLLDQSCGSHQTTQACLGDATQRQTLDRRLEALIEGVAVLVCREPFGDRVGRPGDRLHQVGKTPLVCIPRNDVGQHAIACSLTRRLEPATGLHHAERLPTLRDGSERD